VTGPVARIIVESETKSRIFAPYEARELIKSFPGRRWDPSVKCWIVGTLFVDQLAAGLRAAGCEVFVTRPDGTPWTSGQQSAGRRAQPGPGWADAVLAAVGPQRRDKVFAAFAKVLDPDVGGDPALMRELLTAREGRAG
jgi:hypothetical protein